MFELDIETDRERIARLEARVEALERALVRVQGLPAAAAPAPAVLRSPAQPAPDPVATRASLDKMGITAAFDMLDSQVAAAADAESSLGVPRNSPAAFMEIDESLIDKSFARAPAEVIQVASALEELHPKILARIALTWRTPELRSYLAKLIVDERGDRAGFNMHVMSELLLLSAILEAQESTDTWGANAKTI